MPAATRKASARKAAATRRPLTLTIGWGYSISAPTCPNDRAVELRPRAARREPPPASLKLKTPGRLADGPVWR
jgi:hypothetical protein